MKSKGNKKNHETNIRMCENTCTFMNVKHRRKYMQTISNHMSICMYEMVCTFVDLNLKTFY